jgi:hypothetical protein
MQFTAKADERNGSLRSPRGTPRLSDLAVHLFVMSHLSVLCGEQVHFTASQKQVDYCNIQET